MNKHHEGLLALEHVLDWSYDEDGLLTTFIIEMPETVLTKNYLLFENQYYLQVEGTAMGATMAPDYAHLYLFFMKDRYVINNNPFFDNIILYKSYIDDCFVIYKGFESDLFCI